MLSSQDGGRPDGGTRALTLADPAVEDPSQPPEQAEPIGSPDDLDSLIHEPDGAAIRAGLVSYLADQLGARPVGPRIAYLTGATPPPPSLAPFLRTWRVTEILPLRLKGLRARVRELGIGRLEIHKRGVEVSPEALRASLRLGGQEGEVWILTRLGASAKGAVLVVEPLGDDAAPAR